MELAGALDEDALELGTIRIGNATVDRTYGSAFLVIEEADAFGTLLGNYVIDVFGYRTPLVAV
jgi:hypothetical protein